MNEVLDLLQDAYSALGNLGQDGGELAARKIREAQAKLREREEANLRAIKAAAPPLVSDYKLITTALDRGGIKYNEDIDGDGLDDAIAIHVGVREGRDGAADFGVVFLFDQSGKLHSLGAQK